MSIQAAVLYGTVSIAGAETSVGKLRNVSNAADAAQSRLSRLGANAAQVGKGVGQVAGGMVRVGELAAAALLATGVAAEKVTMGFQAQMELIHTQAGASQAEVVAQAKAIEALVHQVGTSPDELAKGLYHIESVGLRGAQALDVLRASALGAKMGLADMESISNALTAVSKFGSGIGGVKDMTSAMATLNAIVGVGNMRMQDLADSFGTGILGTARTFGVGLRELGSALAVLTDAGVPANNAATRLSMTFSHMAAPTAAAIKVFAKLGLSQFSLAADLRKPDGIFVAFQDLHDHLAALGEIQNGVLTPQGTADVTKIFGGSRFGATAMQLLEQMDRIKLKYDQIGVAQQTFTEKMQQTFATTQFGWGQFLADLKNSLLVFGEGIDPAVGRALHRLDDLLVSHLGDIRRMGVDAGKAIDGIDWTKVEHGVETFVGLLKTGWGILSKVPAELDIIVAGFLGINKLSGGLIGTGLGNIVGGLGKGVANVLLSLVSKVPLVGGALGAATATRVFVVNMPGSGFGPGGLGGAAGDAAAAGGGLVGTFVTAFGGTLAVLAELKGGVDALASEVGNLQSGNLHAAIFDSASLASPGGMIARAIFGTSDPIGDLIKGLTGWKPPSSAPSAASVPTGGGNTPWHYAGIGPGLNGPLGGGNSPTHYAGIGPGLNGPLGYIDTHPYIEGVKDLDQSVRLLNHTMTDAPWLKKLEDSWRKAGQTMHDRIKEALAGLSGPNAGKAASFLGSHLGASGFGAGGYDQALAAIAQLKALNSSDPAVAKAIRDLTARLPRLQTDKTDLAAAIAIANGTDPKNRKLDELNGIMADLRAHGDKTTRAKVQDLINAVKHQKLHTTVNLSPELITLLMHSGAGPNATIKYVQGRKVSGTVSEFASGGAYPAGIPRLVGEEGPELDIPTGPGFVFTREQTRALARALGPGGLSTAMEHLRGASGRATAAVAGALQRVEVRPFPVRLVVNGRELAAANVLSDVFTRD